MKPEQTLAWMRDGTERLLTGLAELPDRALTASTALPGGNRRYLISHLAAEAAALRNLAHWARTGEERAMYSSLRERDAGIAAGAELPAVDLRALMESTAAALTADLDELGDGPAWDAKVITAQGLARSASEIPWMRACEVYLHGIDLRTGTGFRDLPAEFLTALLDDVTVDRSARGGGPAVIVAATDTGDRWDVAGTGIPVPVSAPLPDLAAWLTGRPAPALPSAPHLPPWL
jgi:maleylpyruvate isomerase